MQLASSGMASTPLATRLPKIGVAVFLVSVGKAPVIVIKQNFFIFMVLRTVYLSIYLCRELITNLEMEHRTGAGPCDLL
jgi:hypothetical protein